MTMKALSPGTLGDAIKMVRDEKHLTLAQISAKAGLSVSYLSDIERGRTLPSLDALMKLSVALDHKLLVGMSDDNEVWFPCTPAEAELLYALRQRDFNRFALMVAAITTKPD